MIDFAGGTVVHINAGVAGLIGAYFLGKRLGYGKEALKPHSVPYTFIGASLLNWLMLSVMEWLRDNQHPLPVLRSQNIPGAIDHNRQVGAKYKHRLTKQLA